MRPLVSVIVPVYNSYSYLRACLDSILGQNYESMEVICVDDGSTDGSDKLLREIAERDARIKVITQENRGLGSARNMGISNAKGKYVWFVDSDDQIEKDSIKRLVDEAEVRELDLVIFSARVVLDKNAKNIDKNRESKFELYYSIKEDEAVFDSIWDGRELFARLVERGNLYVSVPLRFIRKSVLDETRLRFTEGLIHEDNYFTPLLILRSRRTSLLHDKFYVRSLHDDSMMTALGTESRHAIGILGNIMRLIGDLKDDDLVLPRERQAMLIYCKNQLGRVCSNFCVLDSDTTDMMQKSINEWRVSDVEKRFAELAVFPLLELVRESRQKRKTNKFLRLSGRLRKWFIRRK